MSPHPRLTVSLSDTTSRPHRPTGASAHTWRPYPPPTVSSSSRRTARHLESGVASFGDTAAEALRQLGDALESHRGEGDPIDDPEAYLWEQGIDVEIGQAGPPPWE